MPKRNVKQPAHAVQALPVPAMNTPGLQRAPALLEFDQEIVAGTVNKRSIAKYAKHFAAYCAFAQTPDHALLPTTLARWRTTLAQQTPLLTAATINTKLSAIKSVLHAAGEQGYVTGELAAAFGRVRGVSAIAMKDRRSPHRRTFISEGSMRALCDAPDVTTARGVRDRALLHTLASSGMRASATASLQYQQIVETDEGVGIWVIDKNDPEPRLVLLSHEARRWIEAWRTTCSVTSAFVFTSYDGRGVSRLTAYPMSPTAIWQIVRSYAVQVGLEYVKPHDFRRFLGTRLSEKDIRLAQKALGHADIRTTAMHYDLRKMKLGQSEGLY